MLHARLFQVPEAEIPVRVTEMVERFGLAGQLDRLPATLPLGQRQRLSLAVAMIHRPELLILDEPTVGLDPLLRAELWERFAAMAAGGTTLLVSSHVMDEATRCDRLLLIRAGQILSDSTLTELLARTGTEDAESAFLALIDGSAA